MNKQQIDSSVDLAKFFTMMPNIIDDADLDPYEFRLLLHYYRVGKCWEGTKTTARKCNMGMGTVSKKRRSLSDKGWIILKEPDKDDPSDTIKITVVDKWLENYQAFSPDETPPSPDETPPSPGETKKNHNKKNQDEEFSGKQKDFPGNDEKPKTDHQILMKLYQDALGYKIPNGAKEGAACKKILKAGYTPEQAIQVYHFKKKEKFYKHQHLSLVTVHENMGAVLSSQNGNGQNAQDAWLVALKCAAAGRFLTDDQHIIDAIKTTGWPDLQRMHVGSFQESQLKKRFLETYGKTTTTT